MYLFLSVHLNIHQKRAGNLCISVCLDLSESMSYIYLGICLEPNEEKAANFYHIFYLSVHLCEASATLASTSASADSLAPLLDEVGVGILLQTLGDVVADLDQTLPGVLQLLALRQALLGPVQLLQRRLHRPHSLLALQARRSTWSF